MAIAVGLVDISSKDGDKWSFAAVFLILIGVLLVLGLPILFSLVLCKKKQKLELEKSLKTIGALYSGQNVDYTRESPNKSLWLHPLVYFFRRSIFVAATVFLFDQPQLQLSAHMCLTMCTLVFITVNKIHYLDKLQFKIEFASEILLLTHCSVL